MNENRLDNSQELYPGQLRIELSNPETKQEQIFQEVFLNFNKSYTQNICKLSSNDQKKILMIYTGGVIATIRNKQSSSSDKVGDLKAIIRGIPNLCDPSYTFFNGEDGFLITPTTIYGKRIWYKIEQFDESYENSSFDTGIQNWLKIAQVIEANYNDYDAFVILHDTDTMAYTASALSFMLENLSKTVIITGSQVPLSEMRNDAFENLQGALTIAGHFTIPEVAVYFYNKLFRGNRTTKIDSFERESFDSPNMKPLVVFGVGPRIEWDHILKVKNEKFAVSRELSEKVGVLKFYPSIPLSLVKNILESDIEACVIEAYAVGELPLRRKGISELLKKASEQGKLLVVVTQCLKGEVHAPNGMGKLYEELGLIPGLDMTVECAIAKLTYLLGKNLPKEEVKKLVGENLRGEMTEQVAIGFERKESSILETIACSFNNGVEQEVLKDGLLPTLSSYAAHFGYVHILEYFKSFGAKFESGDYEGRTPLHVAAKCGQADVIKHIIEQKMDLDITDKRGRSAMFEAIFNKQYSVAEFLQKSNAKVFASTEDLRRLLFKLVAKSDLEGIRLLYYGGVHNLKDYKNIDSRTIAHIACADGKEKIVEFLKVQAKFDFTVKDRWDQTPLDDAIRVNDRNIIRIVTGGCLKYDDHKRNNKSSSNFEFGELIQRHVFSE